MTTFKVQFENNIPVEASEVPAGVVLKKWTDENGIKIFEWMYVEAETSEAALMKAKEIVDKENTETTDVTK
jgi:hypothetical protein